MSEKFLPDEWDRAYAAGLDAAREAVAALRPKQDGWHPDGDAVLRLALAAIDALRQPPPLTAHYDPAAKDNRP